MFAVIRTGGKQYKVSKNDILEIEKLDVKEGAKIDLDVLMVSDGTTADLSKKGAKVSAKVIKQKKDDKVVVFKKRRRHNYRRKQGHRQNLTVIEITDIAA
jgi:large subunit ribosomal protein L21